jgi:hypothetical protein
MRSLRTEERLTAIRLRKLWLTSVRQHHHSRGIRRHVYLTSCGNVVFECVSAMVFQMRTAVEE